MDKSSIWQLWKDMPQILKDIMQNVTDVGKEAKAEKIFGDIPVVSDILYVLFGLLFFIIGLLSCFTALLFFLLVPFLVTVWDSSAGILAEKITELAINDVLDEPGMDNPILRKILSFGKNLEIMPHTVSAVTNVLFIIGYFFKMTSYSVASFELSLNEMFRPAIPDPSVVIRAAMIAPEKIDEAWSVLRKHGYQDKHIELMFISNYLLYDVTTIKELFLRGEIDESKMYERMMELGFTKTRIDEIRKTWDIIPSPQDLLWMVGKEAFEPDQISRYGLDDEFPTEQSKWLSAQGLSDYWQKKYWAAHWDYPSPGQVLEMLHRGIFNEQDVYDYYRVVEMPPYWREKLMQISYNPYARVDVRRMHKMGVLTDNDLIKAYMDEGYDLEHATKLSEFTIKYNTSDDALLTKTQIEEGYRIGLLDYDEAITFLLDIGYVQYSAEYILQIQDYKIEKEYVDEVIALTKDQYKYNLINEQEVGQRLTRIGYGAVKIQMLIDKWKVTAHIDDKLPSKSDLDEFLIWGIITPEEYVDTMRKLSYPEYIITWYLQLVLLQISEKLSEEE
ncbi:MAG: hypothetical protein PHH73_04795 [Candidatus Rickettsiella isopodorum]|nr:hypothetical protein [Candidatus Rickettsiella isopodorum]